MAKDSGTKSGGADSLKKSAPAKSTVKKASRTVDKVYGADSAKRKSGGGDAGYSLKHEDQKK